MRRRYWRLRFVLWPRSGRSRLRSSTPSSRARISGTRCCHGFRCRLRRCIRASIPLWDPYLLGGQPLAGQVQPAVFSPLTWLLWLTPLDGSGHLQLAWIHAWFVLLHVLAGFFAYAFLRDLAGAASEACIVGAVFFGAAGFVGNTPWPQIAAGAIWLPLRLSVLYAQPARRAPAFQRGAGRRIPGALFAFRPPRRADVCRAGDCGRRHCRGAAGSLAWRAALVRTALRIGGRRTRRGGADSSGDRVCALRGALGECRRIRSGGDRRCRTPSTRCWDGMLPSCCS